MNSPRRCGIQPGEEAAHAAWAALLAIHQPGAGRGIAFGETRKAIEKSPEIESRTADNHRQAAAAGDFLHNIPSNPGVLACGVTVGWVEHVQQMVRDTAALRQRCFGGADVEAAIKLEGIAIDDLARKFFANPQRECAFAGSGWAGDHDQGGLRMGIHLLSSYPAGVADLIY